MLLLLLLVLVVVDDDMLELNGAVNVLFVDVALLLALSSIGFFVLVRGDVINALTCIIELRLDVTTTSLAFASGSSLTALAFSVMC